jgi:homoserine O-succinyltransferase
MIVTGAPVELLEFDRVDYWDELSRIMAYAAEHIHTTLYLCWAAQAALYHHYRVQKHELGGKLSGVFSHRVLNPACSLFRGFDDVFLAPHSRHTEIRREDLETKPDLEILAESDEAGVAVVQGHGGRQIFMTGHLEYDRDTLDKEYRRDADRGLTPRLPAHYYPEDDPGRTPPVLWRAHAHLFYSNWLNYYVYQSTPYLLRDIGNAMPHTGKKPD